MLCNRGSSIEGEAAAHRPAAASPARLQLLGELQAIEHLGNDGVAVRLPEPRGEAKELHADALKLLARRVHALGRPVVPSSLGGDGSGVRDARGLRALLSGNLMGRRRGGRRLRRLWNRVRITSPVTLLRTKERRLNSS